MTDTPTSAEALTADDFYAELTTRNRGLIPESAQLALGKARVLVAGCGSTGGAAVEPLVRLGVRDFVLAEPGEYELNNLNRQHARLSDLGRNKAEVSAELARSVNPHARVEVHTDGVQEENVTALLDGVDVVVDGVDVTTIGGWRAKFQLHAEAARRGVPVVSGYDMSGTQFIRYYDYRQDPTPLAGRVTAGQLETEEVWDLLLRIIPRELVPLDLVEDIRAHRSDPDYSVPQLVYTSHLFGVLAARYTVAVLAGVPVRAELTVDVHALVADS
ncbi:ThiF family adenylyltransferase [Kitasatospora sp. NPDC088346]|uniref:ThiF family adenylyltransferase n=1 Tax=Kitasatospora sp. NPDC088346 TaxID=3364073 RepID=UPI00382CCFBA